MVKYLAGLIAGGAVLAGLVVFSSPDRNPPAPGEPPLSLAPAGPDTAPGLGGERWNRFTTDNFEVLSLDLEQGRWLADNAEQVRAWVFTRWGLPNLKFRTRCRIVCAPDDAALRKAVGADKTTSRAEGGQWVVWLNFSGRGRVRDFPAHLTEACLLEYEAQSGRQLGLWVHRGAALLDRDGVGIRTDLQSLRAVFDREVPVFWSPELFQMTAADLAKQNKDSADWFDREAAAACLFVRREFALSPCDPAASAAAAADPARFNGRFKQFMASLAGELAGGRVPPGVLAW